MVDTGGNHGDFRILHFLGDYSHIYACRADPGGAPYIDLAPIGESHGKGAEAVNHLNIILQFLRHRHHGHGGRDALLCYLCIGIAVGGHEAGPHEHNDEHQHQQA